MTHTDQSRAEFEHNQRVAATQAVGNELQRLGVHLSWPTVTRLVDLVRATTEQSSGVELPEPVAHINQNGVIHEAGYGWSSDNYLSGLYTEQQVRALLAGVKDSLTTTGVPNATTGADCVTTGADPVVTQVWIAVGGQLPEIGKPVLLDIGRKHPIRAMWAARLTLEAGDACPEDWAEYDDAADKYYCPEGWYEWNEHEDTHWRVSADPIRWMPLPQPPKEQT